MQCEKFNPDFMISPLGLRNFLAPHHYKGGGQKKRPVFVVFDYEGGGGGVSGNAKRLRSFFYKLCFFWSVPE